METISIATPNLGLDWPHSLGQSVEWKRSIVLAEGDRFWGPHSLGQSVEWKLFKVLVGSLETILGPHSLGQSVEWKHLYASLIHRSLGIHSEAPLAGAIS